MLKMLLVRSHTEMKVMLLKIGEALVSNKLGYLAEEISKQSVEGEAGCLLAMSGEK